MKNLKHQMGLLTLLSIYRNPVPILVLLLLLFSGISHAADIDARATRQTGVAPLGVLFHTDLNHSSPSDRTFHEYRYVWSYGDPSNAQWENGQSKNMDTGAVGAHIYESPGTYTATCTAFDASGNRAPELDASFTITVTDPDKQYAGKLTTCVNPVGDNDFAGCPDGADTVNENSGDNWDGYTQEGERLLFKRGGTWSLSTTPAWGINHGPVTISAYGDCSGETKIGTCDNDPRFIMTTGRTFMRMHRVWNRRILNLNIVDGTTPESGNPGGIVGDVDYRNLLMMRNTIQGFSVGIAFSHHRTNASHKEEKNFIFENQISGSHVQCVYIGSEYLTIMGNRLYDTLNSHVLRVWLSYIGRISHNHISGASMASAAGNRAAMKFHGPAERKINSGQSDELSHRSRLTLVSHNVFGESGDWPCNITPMNSSADERILDIIIEKNRFIADYGSDSNTQVMDGLNFSGRFFTVRNNIHIGTGAQNTYFAIRLAHRGSEPFPEYAWIYNNTIYSGSNHTNRAIGVWIDKDAKNVFVKNNYISFPNVTGTRMAILDQGNPSLIQSHNVLTDTPHFVDPDNHDPLVRDFRLTDLATLAIDQGTTVPVSDDFDGTPRANGTPYDIGAFEKKTQLRPHAPKGLTIFFP